LERWPVQAEDVAKLLNDQTRNDAGREAGDPWKGDEFDGSTQRQPISSIPAMMVATVSSSTPHFLNDPKTITTKAPVGPPICTREPPSAEMMNPAITAV